MEKCLIYVGAALLILINMASASSTAPSNLATDQYALLAFKHAIVSDRHGVLTSDWSLNTPVCSWIGVTCSINRPTPPRVTALNVSGFELGGTIAPHLGNLTFLQILDISYNYFTGSIPSHLSNLRFLKDIKVGVNKLRGEIPSWFGVLSELQYVCLKHDIFSGKIPT